MFQHVVQRLLEGEEQVVSRLRGHRLRRQRARQAQRTLDVRVLKILPRVLAEVIRQMFEVVVAWVHDPDDFIERLQQFPGSAGNGF
jgi:hypothetical protein